MPAVYFNNAGIVLVAPRSQAGRKTDVSPERCPVRDKLLVENDLSYEPRPVRDAIWVEVIRKMEKLIFKVMKKELKAIYVGLAFGILNGLFEFIISRR